MFFEGDRIDAMREMILAGTKEERAGALTKLLPYQRDDFIGIFTALKGLPATIRFLDPPLHEFLPNDHAQQNELANKLGVSVEQICAACPRAARIQSDARPSRLPARHRLSGDFRDAGARNF